MTKESEYTLAVVDAETDPFLYGRKPLPFAWGLFDGLNYFEFWGQGETRDEQSDNCTDALIEKLNSIKSPLRIYAHNGGKFDFFYLLEKGVITDPVKIINGRIVSARIGIHEIRDSYAILPVPLAAYQKDKIDYNLFEFDKREKHKADILHYLASDCEYLYELVHAFVERFGYGLTIGGTAIKQLKKMHPFKAQNDTHDERFRPYYFGGRVQCFEKGIFKRPLKYCDVNSMYPDVMANKHHPTGKDYILLYENDLDAQFYKTGIIKDYPFNPYFITFKGWHNGAFCSRTDKGLNFETCEGEFKTMSHELQIALKYNLVRIDSISEIFIPRETIQFSDYVHTFIADKIQAKKDGDKTKELFSKLLLNSSYGKFGQNPANFYDWVFRYPGEPFYNFKEWELFLDAGFVELWRRPAPKPVYYDVATAASITSAARAVLLEAIVNSTNPLYCDTDSLICEDLQNVNIDSFKLGAWDIEATGNELHLAGKKLYCLFNNGKVVKQASKGAKLTPGQISDICRGEEIEWRNMAPNFKFDGTTNFVKRTIKMI